MKHAADGRTPLERQLLALPPDFDEGVPMFPLDSNPFTESRAALSRPARERRAVLSPLSGAPRLLRGAALYAAELLAFVAALAAAVFVFGLLGAGQ